jgi:Zn-dependent protease with chaperone function
MAVAEPDAAARRRVEMSMRRVAVAARVAAAPVDLKPNVPFAQVSVSRRRVEINPEAVGAMNDSEIDAVLAHELRHIQDRRLLYVVGGAVLCTWLAAVPVLALVVSPAATLALAVPVLVTVRAALAASGRHFERRADRFSARVTQRPEALASVLERTFETGTPSRGILHGLFAIHPPTAKRVQQLRAMQSAIDAAREPANSGVGG